MGNNKSKYVWIVALIICIIMNSYFFFDGEPISADFISLVAVIFCSTVLGVALYE